MGSVVDSEDGAGSPRTVLVRARGLGAGSALHQLSANSDLQLLTEPVPECQ